MPRPEDILAWARKQVGTKETPPNSNRVHYWDDIGRHDLQGQPWCGAFVTAGFRSIGMPDVSFVYCPAGKAWFAKQGRLHDKPQPGDVVFYEWERDVLVDHTGIVESVWANGVVAIEGNTQSGDKGNQSDGGGVFRRTRPFSVCSGFGRPAWSVGSTPVKQRPVQPTWEYQEAEVRTTLLLVGPLDKQGRGFEDWNPGLSRDPVIVGTVKQGPDPSAGSPDDQADDPYWEKQGAYDVKASPRGGVARVVVTRGAPGATVGVYVSVA